VSFFTLISYPITDFFLRLRLPTFLRCEAHPSNPGSCVQPAL